MLACVEGGTRTDELLPPARTRIQVCGVGVGGGREASEEEDGVASVCIESSPCLVGDCVFGEDATPVQKEGFVGMKCKMLAGCIGRLGPRGK
jgi:hypothetical protein